MRKITFLFLLLMVSLGYSQTDLIESFDGAAPTVNAEAGNCGPGTYTVSSAQASTGSNSLEIITTATGNAWQGTELILQGDHLDLTTVTGNKLVNVDVYSLTATDILAKVTAGGPASATDANHTGSGWETLTFNFANGKDNTGAANGVYSNLIFYPLWNTTGGTTCSTGNGCYAPYGNECVSASQTIYVDNILGTAPGAPTCSDGIQNGTETGVDCGGTCAACPPAGELLTNGDFETGTAAPWGGDAANPVDDGSGSNFVNQAEVLAAGNPWDVSLSQGDLSLTDGVSYTLSFDAYTGTGTTRSMDVGIGQDTSPFDANIVSPVLTDVLTNYSYDLVANYGSAGAMNTRVVFDMGAETGFVFIDNVSLIETTLGLEDAAKTTFRAFPNPTQDSWTVRTDNVNMLSIQLLDVLGKTVLSLSPNTSEITIDGSSLKSGLYFAQIKTETGVNSIKLVRN